MPFRGFEFGRRAATCAYSSAESLHPMKNLSQLKICFLAGTLGQGGAERQLFYILSALRQSGAVPRLLCLGRNEFWEGRIKDLGVPITCVGQPKARLMRLFRIISELRKHPLQIFQSQHFYTSAYVGVAARLLGLCGIGAMRNNGLSGVMDSGPIGAWLGLRAPKVIAANSRAAIRYATEHGVRPERLYLLPNVVDTTQFRPTARLRENQIRLITVGRFIQNKRLDRFLSALARLREGTKRDVKGTIVGAGPLKEALEKHAGALGLLPDGVEFKGSVSDMAPVYAEADICVLTSESEGTPNVLLEAMASGLPVVATEVGGVPEIVRQGENGFLAPSGDEDSLCAALARLINDSRLRMQMGKNARGYVEANHSVDGLPVMLTGLYRLA
jgi:glycosyltransferase involved in cell wall biosynthesis